MEAQHRAAAPKRQRDHAMNTTTRACAHCAHVTAYWQARIAAHRRTQAAEIAAYRREFEREQKQIERDSL